MSFIQIIKYHTTRFDEVERLGDEVEATSGAPHGYTSLTLTKDHNDPNTYYSIVEFPTYEIAMKNSDDPATQAFAAKMVELCDTPPEFINLDVERKR